MRRTFGVLALVFLTSCVVRGRATTTTGGPPPPPPNDPVVRPPPPPPQPGRPVWNPDGWTFLGERTVDGRMDRDTIDIRNPVGTTYKKLTVVVLDSDLELVEMHLSFRSGVNYPTDIKNVAFREGTRTRVINLPSEVLTRVTFTYRNLPGGGRARVQLWGGEQVRAGNPTTGAPPSPTIPPASNWTTIGERELADGGNGDVTIDVKNSPATGFRTLQVVAMGADVQITEMKVWFKSGKSYATNLKQVLKAGERSQEIALSSDVLTRVTFKYKDAPGAGKPRLQVVGK